MEQKFRCGGASVVVNIQDEVDQSVANEIFKLREYRAAESYIAAATAPLFDVGAHAGFFTLYARAFNSSVPIIALEPEPNNLAQCRKNLERNTMAGVQLLPLALAGASGRRKLSLATDSHNHALAPLSGGSATGQDFITVQAITLPGLMVRCKISAISLLKCDIEGGEYEVFASLQPADYQRLGAVIMEYHNLLGRHYKIIEAGLRGQGFGVQIFPSKFDKTMGFLWAVNKSRKSIKS